MRWLALALLFLAAPAAAQTDWAARLTEGDVTLADFRFRSGETLPELRIHYATLGTPRRDAAGHIVNAVMVLHGTGGTRPPVPRSRNSPTSSTAPASRSISRATTSSSPTASAMAARRSRATACACASRITIMTTWSRRSGACWSGSASRRLRLLMGTSMGCMHGFVWAETHPDFARAIMPMACLPTEIAGHNRMWRRMAVEGIRHDPAWQEGNYAGQPVQGLRTAVTLLQVAGMAPLYLQRAISRPRERRGLYRRARRPRHRHARRQRSDLPARGRAAPTIRCRTSSGSARR